MKDLNGKALKAGDVVRINGELTTRKVIDLPSNIVYTESVLSSQGYTWFYCRDVEKVDPVVLDKLGTKIEVGDRVFHITRNYAYTVEGFSSFGDLLCDNGDAYFGYSVVVVK